MAFYHIVHFHLGNLMLRIVQTLHLYILDVSHEIQLLFTIMNMCFVLVVLQFI